MQELEYTDRAEKCGICDEWTYYTPNTHVFLSHTLHHEVYMCRWCSYADLVTNRFERHIGTIHRRDIDVESCFKPCIVFGPLLECPVEECDFRTNSEVKLDAHKPVHEEEEQPGVDIQGTIQLGELSANLQRLIVREQRRKMAEQSTTNKIPERMTGLPSPPLTLDVELEKPVQPVRPRVTPPTEDNQPRRYKRVTGFGRGKISFEMVDDGPLSPGVPSPPRWSELRQVPRPPSPSPPPREPEEQPVAARTRRRVKRDKKKAMKQEDITPERRNRIRRAQEELFCALRNKPRMAPRPPFLLPIEQAAKAKPRARYIAELHGGDFTFFMCFYALMPACQAVLIQRRMDEKVDIVQGVSVDYHLGAPETYRAGDPTTFRWTIRGPLYDVGTRPWSVVRKFQMSSTPEIKLYVLLNPESLARYNTEVFRL